METASVIDAFDRICTLPNKEPLDCVSLFYQLINQAKDIVTRPLAVQDVFFGRVIFLLTLSLKT